MDSTDVSVTEIDRALSRYGRMNFYQSCTVDGHPGRITMNNERVFLAVHAIGVDVVSEPFEAVGTAGTGRVRQVRFGDRRFNIDFEEETYAARFARVLGVRHNPYPQPATPTADTRRRATVLRPGAAPAGSPQHKYRQYADWAMLASGALIVLGFLDLIGGGIVGLALLITGGGWIALAWLVFAVLGSAGPFCLACLTRMIVYRDRAAASTA